MEETQELQQSPRSRRIRFVCVSDTHNQTPKLPKGDVLIHAGDLTNQGSFSEVIPQVLPLKLPECKSLMAPKLSKTVHWLEKADFQAKIVIAGNHDITLDRQFYDCHGAQLHNQSPQSADRCLELLASSPSITYLNHSSATIDLADHHSWRTSFTVFGSPYSPSIGNWAFGYRSSTSGHVSGEDVQEEGCTADSTTPSPADLWSAIPLDTDIVVTHTPSFTHCDQAISKQRAMGCEDLRRALWRIRPKLAVCGHVHEGRGAERIQWDVLGLSGSPYAEVGVETWKDPGAGPGNNKLCLVDLTARGGNRPLDNDGSVVAKECSADRDGLNYGCRQSEDATMSGPTGSDVRGVGGDPSKTAKCDMQALACRLGRKETCVVNCAIAATNWPHVGGKRFNKPIVVDLDLPIERG